MRRRKLEMFMAWMCVIDIVVGLVLASGVFEGSFQWDPFKMFTVLNALWALLYYLLEIRYLQVGGRGVISTAMRFTIFINATGMALIGMIYLGPMHSSLVGPYFLALVLIQYVLPGLMFLDYLIGLKNTFRKKHILYAMIFPMAYNAAALIMGAAGYGFGMAGAKYPYPFLNVEQLGWGIVSANVGMLIVVMYLYCRLWIFIDRLGKHND